MSCANLLTVDYTLIYVLVMSTHGISMGSIGQYDGVKDYIYNAHIENVTMLNAQVSAISSKKNHKLM